MEQEKTELYMRKLKESIEVTHALLVMESDIHKGLNEFNLQFQTVLQSVFQQSQATLPFFEGLTSKLSEEENQVLVQSATYSTAAHQQLFELWKGYKDLQTKAGNNLTESAEKIKILTQ